MRLDDPELRASGLGGSDAPRVIFDPWGLWLEKTGQAAPLIETEPMAWGKRLEATVAAYYAERNGVTIRRSSRTWRHKRHRFLFGHLDRLVGTKPDGGLEVKTRSAFSAEAWGPSGLGPIPIPVRLQVVHYLAVTDLPWIDVAVLIGGQEYREYRIERDEDEIGDLVDREVAFWDLVRRREPPEVDGSEAARRWYEERRAAADGTEVIDVDTNLAAAAEAYLAARATKEQAEEAMAYWSNRVRSLMGTAAKAVGAGYAISWVERAGPRRIDPAKLIELAGLGQEIVDQATVVGQPSLLLTVRKTSP